MIKHSQSIALMLSVILLQAVLFAVVALTLKFSRAGDDSNNIAYTASNSLSKINSAQVIYFEISGALSILVYLGLIIARCRGATGNKELIFFVSLTVSLLQFGTGLKLALNLAQREIEGALYQNKELFYVQLCCCIAFWVMCIPASVIQTYLSAKDLGESESQRQAKRSLQLHKMLY